MDGKLSSQQVLLSKNRIDWIRLHCTPQYGTTSRIAALNSAVAHLLSRFPRFRSRLYIYGRPLNVHRRRIVRRYRRRSRNTYEKIDHWAEVNHIAFDSEKTICLTVHDDVEISITLQGKIIPQRSWTKYLGAMISSTDKTLYPHAGFSFETQLQKNIIDAKTGYIF